MLITSIENNRIKELDKLKQTKYRKKERMFLIEGEHLVEEALKHNRLSEVFILEGEEYTYPVKETYLSREVMKKISELDSIPTIIGLCTFQDNEGIIGKKIVLLDRVQDPGNLGTIIRSCLAFNVDTLILSKDTVDLYNSKVIRATQGMIFGLNIVSMDLDDAINYAKENNIKVYGTKVDGGVITSSIEKDEKESFCLIMGNEGSGVAKELLDKCDKYLYIKMNKNTESLNVAVATSIILYEMDR